jgi:hypothetical protein
MSWQRLEATTIGADLYEGQEARIADPLWMLGRQWQVGELTGEDAASPILLEALVGHVPLTALRTGPASAGGPVVSRRARGLPLETAVEREDVRDGPAAVRLAAEAGLQLWRALATAGAPPALAAAIQKRFPLQLPADDGLDPLGRLELELLARRSFDARPLIAELAGGSARSSLPGAGAAEVKTALDAWAGWYSELFSEPPPDAGAWDPQHLEYDFQVAAGLSGGEVQLEAAEYAGGHLDWHAFDVARGAPDLGARGTPQPRELRVVPTPARYAGQAASRWWQLEDPGVSFGDLATAPEDLARAVVGGFGMLFGDEWFLVPCRLPSGVLVRAEEVAVLDDFGERTHVRSTAELDGPGRVWRFFELTGDDSADGAKLADRTCPWLLLPPVLAGVTESAPIEEVVFRRDEVANLAWAAELRIESAAGRVVDRAARSRAAAEPPPEPPPNAWLYRLATSVPDYQVPLVPVESTADDALYLQRGRLEVAAAGDEVTTRGALGRILEPESQLLIHDQEVPQGGVRVTRSWQLARQADGGLVLWVGRRKRPAQPQRSPGLLFDEILQDGGVRHG